MNTHTTVHPARAAALIAAAAACLIAAPAAAQAHAPGSGPAAKPANEQVVVPQVDRREVEPPRFPSNDFEIGAFVGTYSAQNFGSSAVYGLRLGYAITEDFFVQANYGSTQVSDDLFRQILPGGIFGSDSERLSYYNLLLGYNVLPGEVFIGAKRALASALYVVGGIGSTDFNEQTRQTITIGLGARVFLKDSFSLQVDVRDYIYSLDLLGKSENTQNLELTVGFSFFF
jgi:outer membrane beta-barrel protein